MTITLSTGTIIAIAKTYGSAVTMSALSNAAEAVATLAVGHGCVVGDYLEVTSGWGRLNGRIVRVKTVATNDITFEGINTVSTTVYPAGTGTGTIRRITVWTNLSQIQEIGSSGGDLQYADITAIDDVVAQHMPTIRSPVTMNLKTFDDPTLAWAAVDARREVQIMETLGQPADHPVLLAFPESAYLHGLIARVL